MCVYSHYHIVTPVKLWDSVISVIVAPTHTIAVVQVCIEYTVCVIFLSVYREYTIEWLLQEK